MLNYTPVFNYFFLSVTKYIFITGGVVSSLGKGIVAASLGSILESRDLSISVIKLDPYINVDPGTMSPSQHGEVFVTYDGAETDLDLGHYERFINYKTSKSSNYTTGQIYDKVLKRERRGEYLGSTVQVIPHITDEIISNIKKGSFEKDICIVEIGGTVGDIESLPFIEAIRQMGVEYGKDLVSYIHLTLVPFIRAANEIKTKPTQHSVKELQGLGIRPDIIVGRSSTKLEEEIATKIAFFADIPRECVISAPDARSIYDVPMVFLKQKLPSLVERRLGLTPKTPDLTKWEDFAERISNGKESVEIALIGKYTDLKDSYISHEESLRYAGALLNCKVKIRWIEAPDLEDSGNTESLEGVNGVLVPGGFGRRGSEGKIMSAKWARETNTPYLGVCFGFQLATIEFARSVLGLKEANSYELDPEGKHSVVDILPEQEGVEDMGATMRLGDHEVEISGGKAQELYKSSSIFERHRHRYEINPEYISQIEEKGMKYTGRDKSGRRMEILELENHPYFLASQFHPEFKSRPDNPSPLHFGLVKAALEHKKIN